MTGDRDERDWALLSVTTAGSSVASLRMFVWRRLKALGAVTLQPSVYLLPWREDTVRGVRRLVDRVRLDGGQAQLLRMTLTDAPDVDWLVEQVRRARDVEYAEVLERLPSFFAELEAETARGRTTFAEVEENEADLDRFDAWVAKIGDRDYFGAPLGPAVTAELIRARTVLAAFEQKALAVEYPVGPPAAVRQLQTFDGPSLQLVLGDRDRDRGQDSHSGSDGAGRGEAGA